MSRRPAVARVALTLAPPLALSLALAGCSGQSGPAAAPETSGSTPTSTSPTSASPESRSPAPSPLEPRQPQIRVPHPVSLPALMVREYDGHGLRLVEEVARTNAYTQYAATYRGDGLTLSGMLNVPHGRGPHPALVLAHGYIDPAVYVSGQGLMREQDYLARAGFVTLHVDYRGHASSDDDPQAEVRLRLGYTVDVINAALALQRGPRFVDDDRIGLVGRSMGGGVLFNAVVVRPGLFDAAVAFAPVSSDTADNFDRWIRPDPGRSGLATEILDRYGDPARGADGRRPAFWRDVSPRTFFERVRTPLMVHHGTSDDSCPIRWTYRTVDALERAGARVRLHVYEGEEHAFVPQWPLSMERTVAFLVRHLAQG